MSTAKVNSTALVRDAMNAVREFDKAILAHSTWIKLLHRGLICGAAVEPGDMREDAHRHCEFGAWFYSERLDKYRSDPAFTRIEVVHTAMHGAARAMLAQHEADQSIGVQVYDHFMDLVIQFKQDARNFQYSLISQVCTIDHLTGAWNRHAMAMKLTEEFERTQRTGQPCALSMMDLDYFKRVNDAYGHPVGDEALRAVTGLVSGELRRNDSLCRYGGEEFLLLLPNTDLQSAGILLNRIREKMETTPLELPAGPTLRITASFGVACLTRDAAPEAVLEQADHALLTAKAEGRNRVCLWEMGVGEGIPGPGPLKSGPGIP